MPRDATEGTPSGEWIESTTRRRFLGTAGALAAATSLIGTGAAASGSRRGGDNTGTVSGSGFRTTEKSGYTEVIVEEDGLWHVVLDDFDILSNYLVDVSAPGANVIVQPRGRAWTVQNLGLRGTLDVGDDHPRKRITPIAPDGGVGTVRNVYMGDGETGTDVQGAIWVPPEHAGGLRLERLNLQSWADNGVYGSPPGNPDEYGEAAGKGGTVTIRDSFGRDNGVASFRLGTDGSSCENCVSVGGDRGFWGYYETTDYVNCDSSGADEQFRAGARAVEKGRDAVVRLANCRAEGPINNGPGTVEGEPGPNPRTSPPDVVPRGAKNAARGKTSLASWTEPYRFVLAVPEGSLEYQFAVAGDVAVEDGDRCRFFEKDGGTVVTGSIEGGRHVFRYAGAIANLWTDGDAFDALVNDRPIDPADLPTIERLAC